MLTRLGVSTAKVYSLFWSKFLLTRTPSAEMESVDDLFRRQTCQLRIEGRVRVRIRVKFFIGLVSTTSELRLILEGTFHVSDSVLNSWCSNFGIVSSCSSILHLRLLLDNLLVMSSCKT